MPSSSCIHERYKRDTDFVEDWLADSAATAPAALKARVRLRPKIEETIRNSCSEPDTTPPPLQFYRMSCSTWVAVAEFISTQKPPIAVPADVMEALNSAIEGRIQYSVQIEQTSPSYDPQSHVRHRNFIAMLRKVRRILQTPAVERPPAVAAGPITGAFAGAVLVSLPTGQGIRRFLYPEEYEEWQPLDDEDDIPYWTDANLGG